MAWIKYPFHVKHDGKEYKPGELIEVNDAAGYKLRGAVEVEIEPAHEQSAIAKPKRVRPAKRADSAEE